ncbi:MAG: hypothetical protein K8I03_14655 [Ignavibacteria bacterium]|nr:hypothetical protein [Ignavibacteria bacterium]
MDKKAGKYKKIKDNIEQIKRLARHGYTNDEICSYLGFEEKLFKEYAVRSDELTMILKNSAIEADLEVEEALLRRAKGYETVEEYHVYVPDSENSTEVGSVKLKEIKKVKKFVPPDASSAVAWLINRKSGRWSKNPTTGSELANHEIMRLKRIAAQEADENM